MCGSDHVNHIHLFVFFLQVSYLDTSVAFLTPSIILLSVIFSGKRSFPVTLADCIRSFQNRCHKSLQIVLFLSAVKTSATAPIHLVDNITQYPLEQNLVP